MIECKRSCKAIPMPQRKKEKYMTENAKITKKYNQNMGLQKIGSK